MVSGDVPRERCIVQKTIARWYDYHCRSTSKVSVSQKFSTKNHYGCTRIGYTVLFAAGAIIGEAIFFRVSGHCLT
jgi:hypothetical protein